MSFVFKSDIPIYLQIIRKEYKPYDRLPSVRELSLVFEVNPNTVKKALLELEETGLIFTERTNGKFVTGDMEVIKRVTEETLSDMVGDFLLSMQKLGYSKEQVLKIIKG